jgi:hypothetical protein
MMSGAAKLIPFGTVLGQDDDEDLVELINARWADGKIPGPVFGRQGTKHTHVEIPNYERLEILWAAGGPRGDYYRGDYDSEAYAHSRLREWERPGADYYENVWKDLATTDEALAKLRAELVKTVRRKPPSREKPFWSSAKNVGMAWLQDNGCPQKGDGHQAELENHIADWLDARGHKAGETTIRRYVNGWIEEYREQMGM